MKKEVRTKKLVKVNLVGMQFIHKQYADATCCFFFSFLFLEEEDGKAY